MNFENKLLGRSSVEDGSTRDSLALPRFSFESDNHSVLNTKRLYRQWQRGEESDYECNHEDMEENLSKEDEIIVSVFTHTWH